MFLRKSEAVGGADFKVRQAEMEPLHCAWAQAVLPWSRPPSEGFHPSKRRTRSWISSPKTHKTLALAHMISRLVAVRCIPQSGRYIVNLSYRLRS